MCRHRIGKTSPPPVKARHAIRRSLRLAAQKRAEGLGRQVFEAILEREAITLGPVETENLLEALGIKSEEALYQALGEGHTFKRRSNRASG